MQSELAMDALRAEAELVTERVAGARFAHISYSSVCDLLTNMLQSYQLQSDVTKLQSYKVTK